MKIRIETQTLERCFHLAREYEMRGTMRPGVIGLAIGLMFMVMAPINANAMKPISIDETESFPMSVNGDGGPIGNLFSETAPHGPPNSAPFGQEVSETAPHGPPDFGGNDGNGNHVSTAPEPATWIMMIAGFWIVAWRMRHRGRRSQGPVAAPA